MQKLGKVKWGWRGNNFSFKFTIGLDGFHWLYYIYYLLNLFLIIIYMLSLNRFYIITLLLLLTFLLTLKYLFYYIFLFLENFSFFIQFRFYPIIASSCIRLYRTLILYRSNCHCKSCKKKQRPGKGKSNCTYY